MTFVGLHYGGLLFETYQKGEAIEDPFLIRL